MFYVRSDYLVSDWVPDASDPDDYALSAITVPDSCGSDGKGGGGGGSSAKTDGEIAGAVVGVMLLVGAVVGLFVYKRRSTGSSSGLGQKFMVSARSNRGAL